MTTKDWIDFEKVVAAIQSKYSPNCIVKWNDEINGRQFDVSLRFKVGLHDYLTLIECKKIEKPLPVDKVDAFVTKIRDAKANKGIIVSSSGFQSGAIEVAKRHGIDLFTLKEVLQIPAEIQKAISIPTFYMFEMAFVSDKLQLHPFPSKDNEIRYWIEKTTMRSCNGIQSLKDFLQLNNADFKKAASDKIQDGEIDFPIGTKIFLPNFFEGTNVKKFRFKYKIQEGLLYSGPMIDPYLLRRINTDYEFTDVITGGKEKIPIKDAICQPHDSLVEGKFYRDLLLGFSYYIDEIADDMLTVYLVESYQHGSFIQSVFKQEKSEAKSLSTITDKNEIRRLGKLLRDMKRRDRMKPE